MTELTINIIFNNNHFGLSNDAKLLVQHLNSVSQTSKLFQFKVCAVPFYKSQTAPATINIFLEIINPLLVHYAKINILIPNQEWFYRDWFPYLDLMDFIWTKTNTANKCFKESNDLQQTQGNVEKLINIGWTSIDRFKTRYKKGKK